MLNSLMQSPNSSQAQQQSNQFNINMNKLQQLSLTESAMNQMPQGSAPSYRNPNMNAGNNMNEGNPHLNMDEMGFDKAPIISSQAAQFQQ